MSNGKESLGGKFPRDRAAEIRRYADEHGITVSMALQRLTKRGLEDMRRDPLAGALVQSAQMLLLASVVALCVAIPFGYPAELVAVAGVMGVGAGGAGTGWAVRSGMLNSIRNRWGRRLATDGGEKE
jgi:hypothetical protein